MSTTTCEVIKLDTKFYKRFVGGTVFIGGYLGKAVGYTYAPLIGKVGMPPFLLDRSLLEQELCDVALLPSGAIRLYLQKGAQFDVDDRWNVACELDDNRGVVLRHPAQQVGLAPKTFILLTPR